MDDVEYEIDRVKQEKSLKEDEKQVKYFWIFKKSFQVEKINLMTLKKFVVVSNQFLLLILFFHKHKLL